MADVENITPYKGEADKGMQVEQMFDAIAPAYDFMNGAMSFGMHKRWRNIALKAALSRCRKASPGKILDVATGTGDLVFHLHKKLPSALITGIDLSAGMLAEARKKLDTLPPEDKNLIAFGKADCLALPYQNDSFDMVSVAYGVRNFSNIHKGLTEINRVLAEGGVVCIIELSVPEGSLTSAAYRFYSNKIIPAAGKLVSGDRRAYSYLPESIAACPQRDAMADLMSRAGFKDIRWKSLTFGAVTFYTAIK